MTVQKTNVYPTGMAGERLAILRVTDELQFVIGIKTTGPSPFATNPIRSASVGAVVDICNMEAA